MKGRKERKGEERGGEGEKGRVRKRVTGEERERKVEGEGEDGIVKKGEEGKGAIGGVREGKKGREERRVSEEE